MNWRNTTHSDSKDNYCTGCGNVTHYQQQKSYSGLRSPGRSYSTYLWNEYEVCTNLENVYSQTPIKVARYSFSESIPPKFEHKLRRQKQSFGKIATTVVLDEDENLLWSGLQRHRSCHSNEMTLLPILLAAVYLGTGNCSSKIIHGSFFLQ